MTLAEESRLYQIALEYMRTTTDQGVDEDDDALALLDAAKAIEVAWLQYKPIMHGETDPFSQGGDMPERGINLLITVIVVIVLIVVLFAVIDRL